MQSAFLDCTVKSPCLDCAVKLPCLDFTEKLAYQNTTENFKCLDSTGKSACPCSAEKSACLDSTEKSACLDSQLSHNFLTLLGSQPPKQRQTRRKVPYRALSSSSCRGPGALQLKMYRKLVKKLKIRIILVHMARKYGETPAVCIIKVGLNFQYIII